MRRSDEEYFMERLPVDGQRIGNYRLMGELQWDEDKYWRVRDRLYDEGKLVLGRGRGGSVSRIAPPTLLPTVDVPIPSVSPVANDSSASVITSESELYLPVNDTLSKHWAQFRRLDKFESSVTASQGRRQTGGTWTRPDITGISERRYTYVQGVHIDVWTFEIKPAWQINVAGVFEAASHSKFANRPFVIFHVPSSDVEEPTELARCVEEAARFGIGLITFEDAADFGTWDVRVDPPRRSPDPQQQDEFLTTQLPEHLQKELIRWQKT